MQSATFWLCQESLNAKITTIDDEVNTTEKFSFPLQEVSVAELASIREKNTPGFVLKKNSHYYYTEISAVKKHRVMPENVTSHMCASCRFLSAASDEDGGCAKVRAFSRNIENFKYITFGFETFNTEADVFIVLNCLHWKNVIYRPTRPITEKDKIALALFLDEKIGSYHDVKLLVERLSRR
ncbi:MAG: hypothetical protein IKF83_03140 [Clostridia bacterium]|nr:hypothetical protein [Clostridia bacterium]